MAVVKQPGIIEWKHLDKRKFYFFAPLAGISTRVILYPTMLVKTRLQVQTRHSYYNGTIDAFRKIVRYEGFRALYKGFLPNTMSVAAGQLYITTYEFLKQRVSAHTTSDIARNMTAGSLASMLSQTVIVPINIVSQRLMVHGQTISTDAQVAPLTARALIRQIYQSEGYAGFFRGYWASLVTFAPSSGIWWTAYDLVRRLQLGGADKVRQGFETLIWQTGAGIAAGVITAVATNPLDVVRARLQVYSHRGDGATWRSVFSQLVREEGAWGLYKGVTARCFYMGSNSFFIIAAYETVKRLSLRDDALAVEQVTEC